MSKLAILGGEKVATSNIDANVKWPIINREIEEATLAVLRDGNMSGTNITKEFETKFAKWNGTKYALAHSCGTARLQAAMFGIGLGRGDELICPSITYWASGLPARNICVSWLILMKASLSYLSTVTREARLPTLSAPIKLGALCP